MLNRFIIALLPFFSLSLMNCTAAGAVDNMACTRLSKKASGDLLKYSLHAEANGSLYFSGISCAMKHRSKELCAMELVSFDTTAKVYDYNTVEEIAIGSAYFWLDKQNKEVPILAFSSQGSAAAYALAHEGGVVLDYTALTEQTLK
jgi:hypothetical protein